MALFVHGVWLYLRLGQGIGEDAWEIPSILYGRPAAIRPGDHLGNLRFEERLRRLSYRKVGGVPLRPGTWSEEPGKIWIFPRDSRPWGVPGGGPSELDVQDGRVMSILSREKSPLPEVRLEPEEIARILGPKMESRRLVPLSDIPLSMQNAVIAAEDTRFYSHFGIDFIGIGRAMIANLRQRRFAQGGSTITQQLAKNFYLSPKKTIVRKLREVELAVILELRFTKRQILEMYLNKIYFGQDGSMGIYGVEEAAAFYFSKHAEDLSLEESALLAGIIRSPNRYSPHREPQAAKERRNAVLLKMLRQGMIGESSYIRAAAAPLDIRPRSAPARPAAYFVDYIERITAEDLGDEELYRTGYRFHTTLDPVHQEAAEDAVALGLAEIEKSSRPSKEPLQAALVAMDPTTGELTAMVGGRSYGTTQFNRAVRAKRQPGSAFKPFVLLSALSQAAHGDGTTTLSTFISGAPVSFMTPEGLWTPSNFDGKAYGDITVRTAIENSVNTATVRLAKQVGLEEVAETAREAGITSRLPPVPSMALGTFEVTPLELAYAYGTIASLGIRSDPFALRSVADADGDVLLEWKARRERTIDPRAAYLTAYALEGVLARGTGRSARELGIDFPASGKTGTTDDNRDSWFVGFTPDVVCAVWVGYDSGADTGLTGARGALRIWARFMKALYPQAGPVAFMPPDGVEFAEIDPESGFLATTACPQALREAYLAGTAPTETCPLHPVNPVVDTIRKGFRSFGDYIRSLFK